MRSLRLPSSQPHEAGLARATSCSTASASTGTRISARKQRRCRLQPAHALFIQNTLEQRGWQCEEPKVEYLGLQDGRQAVRSTIQVPVPRSAVFDCITDYNRAADVFSNVASSHTQQMGSYTQVTQSCTWHFLLFKGHFEMVVAVTEEPAKSGVNFELVRSKFMRAFTGRWHLQPCSADSCQVTYTMEVAPTLSPPPAFAGYMSKIFVRQAKAVVDDLVNELRRRKEEAQASAVQSER